MPTAPSRKPELPAVRAPTRIALSFTASPEMIAPAEAARPMTTAGPYEYAPDAMTSGPMSASPRPTETHVR